MGQAKQRRLAGEMPYQQEQVPLDTAKIELLCDEARALFEDWYIKQYAGDRVTAMHLSNSCHVLSILTQAVLKKNGFDAKAVGGYASWRCGLGNADTLSHIPPLGVNQAISLDTGYINGHYWITIGQTIVDPTLIFFKDKVAMNDAQDGFKTHIAWEAPKTLISQKGDPMLRKSINQVAQAYELCYAYEESASFNAYLQECRETLTPMIMKINNPQMMASFVNDDGSLITIK